MSKHLVEKDTIVAQATPPGKGGIGVIRLSGSMVPELANALLGSLPSPRMATYRHFLDKNGTAIDQGIALYFKAPNSFTGEHVLELQGHGGSVVLGMVLERCVALGARLANPGEFSERAFLNDKIDLAQAEAIADLIDSASTAAARGALKSLQGEFSKQIKILNERVIKLRMYVEAAIDFPEEEIDFLAEDKVEIEINEILETFSEIAKQAHQGVMLREGVSLVIAGRPNAGKSSLMNILTGRDSSIVTSIAGTTRDIIDEHIHLDGLPLRLIDTAGIREAADEIEEEGLRRALNEIERADRLLLVVDCNEEKGAIAEKIEEVRGEIPSEIPTTIILNKIDLNSAWQTEIPDGVEWLGVSAKTGEGMQYLREYLKEVLGYTVPESGTFIARSRHVNALRRATSLVEAGRRCLIEDNAGELLAEELKICQRVLGEITGEFTSDDLLGRIFSSFCIGK
ncbi:MAG: tRNA uridine-5-carboxymethylaminomethyl(34) synthesis GTPase MnmE [Pseudomonadales bacterium]